MKAAKFTENELDFIRILASARKDSAKRALDAIAYEKETEEDPFMHTFTEKTLLDETETYLRCEDILKKLKGE